MWRTEWGSLLTGKGVTEYTGVNLQFLSTGKTMREPTAQNLSVLEQAIDRLSKGLVRYRQESSDLLVRDGLIKRFKESYGISHKTLKSYLCMMSATPDVYADMPFQDLIHFGNESGLLKSDCPRRMLFREMSVKTSQAYDNRYASDVVREVPNFIQEAQFLRDQLHQRLGS